MRTSLRAVVSLAGWLLVVLCLAGCQRPQEPAEPIPPFAKVDDIVTMSDLWGTYETMPIKADKEYKGKILRVLDVGSRPWSKTLLQDGKGRKYFSIIRHPSPGEPNEERELVRCYLYRPDNPIVEEDEKADSFGVEGVCKGIRGGVIILENCTVFTYLQLGTNW